MLERNRVMNLSKALVLFAISFAAFSALAAPLESQDFSITPVVVDKKAKARDILKESITVVNTSNRKLNLYPSVEDIDIHEGTEEFVSAQDGTERAESLANWIELSRGVVELGPGEEKTIPFVIRVNLNAVPGSYHAVISFAEGSTRSEAEERGAAATATVNLEVQADIKETMQLRKFFSDSIFFSGDDVLFNYQLENIGNQDLQPKGEIRIYDRKGQEVATIGVNEDGKKFSPDETNELASVWSAASGFGKYKALLNVEYGSQKAAVQDTVFFWIIPWQQLLGLFVGSLVVIIFFALYFHRWLEQQHLHKLALAGAVDMELVPPPGGFFWTGAKKKEEQSRMPEPEAKPVVSSESTEGRRSVLSLLKWKMIFMSFFKSRKKSTVQAALLQPVTEKVEESRSTLRAALVNDAAEKQERVALSAQMAREVYNDTGASHTINLKSIARQAQTQKAIPDHVINLKNRS